MTDYSRRSYKKELLDRDDIPFADIKQNMKELNIINTFLGGHTITRSGFKIVLGKKRNTSVCEIGCGGGDNLVALYKYCKEKNIHAHFTGIDMNADCIQYARSVTTEGGIDFIVSDYKQHDFGADKPDIIFASLFCHHFTDEELTGMLQWMKANSGMGFFINDLHRHPLAYKVIKFITKHFSGSYLVKNDAPLSVLRGFTKKEWKIIFQKAGINNYTIKWKWAFRYLITSTCLSEDELRS